MIEVNIMMNPTVVAESQLECRGVNKSFTALRYDHTKQAKCLIPLIILNLDGAYSTMLISQESR